MTIIRRDDFSNYIPHIVEELRTLYNEADGARRFFDWAAGRVNDAAETSIDRMAVVARTNRPETIKLARRLDELECGQFVSGRKGWKTRMNWSYSLRSLGEAAQGRKADLKEIGPEVTRDAADQQQMEAAAIVATDPADEGRFMIADAKRRLADTFGVSPEAIEITIRA
jgi:hypothetical protein